MEHRKVIARWVAAVALTVGALLAVATVAAADSLEWPDGPGDVGSNTSMVLDDDGHPVIAYRDQDDRDLKLVRCDDPNCEGVESPVTVDAVDDVGRFASLALDSSDRPVIAYYDATSTRLKLVRCSNSGCTGSQTANVVDDSGFIGEHVSMALDQADRPVIAYHEWISDDLYLVRCNDPACAGDDESPRLVDGATSAVGQHTSLVLDEDQRPVVAYYDVGATALKLLRCDDPTCAPGGDTIVTVDNSGSVGEHASLALDADGFPVIAYADGGADDLKLARCDDPTCQGGGDTVVTVVASGQVGIDASLVLNRFGNPVIAYHDDLGDDLELLHCDDPVCAGDQPLVIVDVGSVGTDSSMVLDELGNPVISFYDATADDLAVLHCNDPGCTTPTLIDPDSADGIDLVLDADDLAVMSWHDVGAGTLRVARCVDLACTSRSVTAPDPSGNDVGAWSSLALDADGHPVVAYQDLDDAVLKILHCDDPDCVFGGDSLTIPDPEDGVGARASLVLDSDGFPVVAYLTDTDRSLRLMRCDDPDCAGGDETFTDFPDIKPLGDIALLLDSQDRPVLITYDGATEQILAIVCDDPSCDDGNDRPAALRSTEGAGEHLAAVIDDADRPVVAFHDRGTDQLRVLVCKDPSCEFQLGGVVDSLPTAEVDLALSRRGWPVLAYRGVDDQDLRLARCDDQFCEGGVEPVSIPDSDGSTGALPALAVDLGDDAVVAYHDVSGTELLYHREIGRIGASLHLDVVEDVDGDQVADPGEPSLGGFILELYRNGTRIGAVRTDAGLGVTATILQPDTGYVVCREPELGWIDAETGPSAPDPTGQGRRCATVALGSSGQLRLTGLVRRSGLALLDTPCPVFDSRSASGSLGGTFVGGEQRTVRVAGALPSTQGVPVTTCVPAGATSVVVTITSVDPVRDGNLRLSAAGVAPVGGVVNYAPNGLNNSNTVTVPLSADGRVDVFANSSPSGVGLDSTDVRLTVLGHYGTDGTLRYTGLTPCAVADSRSNQGPSVLYTGPFTAGASYPDLDVVENFNAGQGGGNTNCGVPSDAVGVVVNLVAVNSSGGTGALAVGAGGGATPTEPVTGFASLGRNNATTSYVPLGPGGTIAVDVAALTGTPSTHIRVIVLGYLATDGDDFTAVTPCAAFDSRPGQNPSGAFAGRRLPGSTTTYSVTGAIPAAQGGGGNDCGVPADATAVLVNLVSVQPLFAGNFRASAAGTAATGGVLNFAPLTPATNNSNAVSIPLQGGALDLFVNGAPGVVDPTTHVRGIVLGYYR